jgi:Uma2 family endonuclease
MKTEMTAIATPISFARGEEGTPFPLTVAQYHRMICDGILIEGEPVELLDGQLVRKDRSALGANPMTVSTRHATAVARINKLSPKFDRLGCHIRIQQPITLPPSHEPEPDGAIVVGQINDYVDHHPTAKQILCVIEVAESSLKQDRTRKQRIYANSGISVYLIVNLIDRVVESYTQPLVGKGRYGTAETLSAKDILQLPANSGKIVSVPAERLLA